ncbi:class III aminotransferase [Cryptococcus neoformans]|nr:class III aminotransferase [Cryptococcus neoformans var. grubii Bt1]OWZ73073.1 hypothetical protein AYX14_01501 [Cryptococcus neoformans var. grubii]OWZ78770.1 class III aminotransferase [Cryptococcus neoformans var. grubii Bt85]OXG29594.1 class III aminotransferase [Cryptococcus neoformans var. grubii Ze90-1]OXM79927.1 class III aminotransferase [Cryptococcus neoformans var. grubii Bt63]
MGCISPFLHTLPIIRTKLSFTSQLKDRTPPITMSPIALNQGTRVSTTHPKSSVAPTPISTSPTSTHQLHHTIPNPVATKGDGMHFTLTTGETVLDAAAGGAAVSCLGNGNSEVIETMYEQAKEMAYTYHQSLDCEGSEKLAKWLCDRSEGALVAGAFLNSGSEAIEAAIKMARQYWVEAGKPERKYIIARFPSYHGNTLGALAIGNAPGRRDIYRPLISLAAFHHVTSPVYRRYAHPGETEEAYSARLADELEAKILELGPENVIGFFAEPVVGSALGVMPPPKGYFPAMEKVIKKYGTLFIMDEVMSGSGRVGQLFAHQAVGEGVKPDIVAIAKGLGGGYVSISGVFVGQSVADRVREGGQWKNSHTYQNHPINCAVAAKVMEIVEREDLLQNVRERGEQILEELKEAAKGVPTIIDVRGKGLFIGVELDGPSSLKPRLASRVKDQAFKNGLIVMGISGTIDGVEGETTIICPAYTVTKEQISGIVRLLMKSVKEVVEEL